MADQHAIIDRYERLMNITDQAFADRQYDVAYHALVAAMHCAEALGDEQRLSIVEQTAQRQREWIDTYDPGHRLSSQSAASQGVHSIYASLGAQLNAVRLRLRHMRQ